MEKGGPKEEEVHFAKGMHALNIPTRPSANPSSFSSAAADYLSNHFAPARLSLITRFGE